MSTYNFYDLFGITTYPSGESHVKFKSGVVSSGPVGIIASHVRGFTSLGHLLSANGILERLGFAPKWFVPFFPFARDDRRNTKFDGFELLIAMNMVSGMDVTVLDPHSDVLGMLPHIPQQEVVAAWSNIWKDKNAGDICFIVPDSGALKKAFKFISEHKYAICSKRRDPSTGTLSDFSIDFGHEDIEDRRCIIVDDICDGGGTFLGIANMLAKRKPKSLGLAVTHGLFTKGEEVLWDVFDEIFTTGNPTHSRIQSISHEDLWSKGAIV